VPSQGESRSSSNVSEVSTLFKRVGQERRDRRWPTTGKNAIVEQRQEGPRCQESASIRRHGKGFSLVLWSSFSEDDVGVVPSVFPVGTSSLLGVGFLPLVESGFPKARLAAQSQRSEPREASLFHSV
jgi:hypothetical protein